jgi:hypothetical protein
VTLPLTSIARRRPDSTGAQNGVRYAYFAQARRLAIDVNGKVTVYDTRDHRIGGFSQQQSHGGSLGFTSQHGLIDVAKLPVVPVDGAAPAAPSSGAAPAASPPPAAQPPSAASPAASPAPAVSAAAAQPANAGNAAGMDIFAMIDRLAELRSRNILTEAEFNAKKTELLARL